MNGDSPPTARTVGHKPPASRAHRDVYVYFDNDIKVRAPYDALTLAHKVGTRVELARTLRRVNRSSRKGRRPLAATRSRAAARKHD